MPIPPGWKRKAYYHLQDRDMRLPQEVIQERFGEYELFICNANLNPEQFARFQGSLPKYSFMDQIFASADSSLVGDAGFWCERGAGEYWCLKNIAIGDNYYNWSPMRMAGEPVPAYRLSQAVAARLGDFHRVYSLSSGLYTAMYLDLAYPDAWGEYQRRKAREQAGWTDEDFAREEPICTAGRRAWFDALHPHTITIGNYPGIHINSSLQIVTMEGCGSRFSMEEFFQWKLAHKTAYRNANPHRKPSYVLWKTTGADWDLIDKIAGWDNDVIIGDGPWERG